MSRPVNTIRASAGAARAACLALPLALVVSCTGSDGWRTASRAAAGLAPTPEEEQGAVIQCYAAPVWGWRGWFADHTWIALKGRAADSYTVYEVIGWRARRGLPTLRIERDIPDRLWYGSRPRLLADLRGAAAAELLEKVDAAARRYPAPDKYRQFPGPNSNTFTAWIAREVPELGLKLSSRAIGKGYLD